MQTKRFVRIGDQEREIGVAERDGRQTATVDGETRAVELTPLGDGLTYALRLGDRVVEVQAQRRDGGYSLLVNGRRFEVDVQDDREHRLAQASPRGGAGRGGRAEVKAPMPGLVVSVAVAPGDEVAADGPLLSLEAMKMENEIRATSAGTVVEVRVGAGQKVEQGQVLVVVE